MKKVGIITLYGNVNHGNKLQNYALLKKIKEISGYEVFTIFKEEKENIIRKIINNVLDFKSYKRKKTIARVNKQLNYIKYDVAHKSYFDYIVVGSDQIWNYTFYGFDYDYSFASKYDAKKISYAASIGLPKIEDSNIIKFQRYLNDFSNISVRESDAKEYLTDLLNRNVDLVMDPTLLIDRSEWEKYIIKPKKSISKKYIFYYFIGDNKNILSKSIKEYAYNNDYIIIDILDKKSDFYNIDIFEFLYLIHNAELIVTNSFHACVFSFLFDKSFITYEGNDDRILMSSRIGTLLNKYNINNRMFDGKIITENNINHDYTNSYNLLYRDREYSTEFLKKSLDIK